jgi:hypothetical protein
MDIKPCTSEWRVEMSREWDVRSCLNSVWDTVQRAGC